MCKMELNYAFKILLYTTYMKLLIIGHGRHGKDTVCEILKNKYNLNYESSSKICAKLFVYDQLKDKYNYTDELECFNDRHNHREEWYNAIADYNKEDKSRLGREIFHQYDVYCGVRNKAEFIAMHKNKVFDYAIWVDRCNHIPLESSSSMNIEKWMADYIIDNNGNLTDLEFNTCRLMEMLLKNKKLHL